MTLRSSISLFLGAVLLTATAAMAQSSPNGPAGDNVIPDGTRFLIRLNDNLDTSKLKPGKHFTAKLAEDLVAPNGSTIPRGKKVKGHVSAVENGTKARLLLSFDEIDTNHGSMPLIATVTDIPGEHAMKTDSSEGEISKRGVSKMRVVEGAVIGAGIGAAAGAVTAGPHGAIIGAAAGGALGGGAGFLTDRNLKLQKGQQLELRLDRPLQVPLR
jgi:hypothetical protein